MSSPILHATLSRTKRITRDTSSLATWNIPRSKFKSRPSKAFHDAYKTRCLDRLFMRAEEERNVVFKAISRMAGLRIAVALWLYTRFRRLINFTSIKKIFTRRPCAFFYPNPRSFPGSGAIFLFCNIQSSLANILHLYLLTQNHGSLSSCFLSGA